MLSHEFTTREKILLILCLVLAVGIFYYFFAVRGLNEQIALLDTTTVENQITLEQAKVVQMQKMRRAIEENAGKTKGEVMVYNNLANEVNVVGSILSGDADQINSITWNDPTVTGTTVRRQVDLDFTSPNYDTMMNVLSALNTCQYRCILSDFQVQSVTDEDASGTSVQTGIHDGARVRCTLTVTFFETTEGAASTEGLISNEDETTSDTDALVDRSKAYADNK
ncbi:MAG: hypothetical protein VZR02_04955 [Lachnospiraceae bacterium]|nr:hypothetical protein [Lachnospiraceae bacterium]